MATLPPGAGIGAPPRTDMEDNGLRFINEEWNGSIANSEPFTLKWNESVQEEFGQLKLFKVIYPNNGAVAFELVSNLTGKSLFPPAMSGCRRTCFPDTDVDIVTRYYGQYWMCVDA